jgi:hypothetical protein
MAWAAASLAFHRILAGANVGFGSLADIEITSRGRPLTLRADMLSIDTKVC